MTLYKNLQLQVELAQLCRVNSVSPTGESIEHSASHDCDACILEREARDELEAQPQHRVEQASWVSKMRKLRATLKA